MADKLTPADKRYTVIILQWMIAIATSFLVLFPEGEQVSEDPWVHGLIVALLVSVLLLYRLSKPAFYHPYFDTVLMLCDTVLLSAAIYMNGDLSWHLFLVYFFVLFLAALGQSLMRIVLGSVLISAVYVMLVLSQTGALADVGSELYIRITFLFGVSILYGYLTENANRERRRAEVAEEREQLKMGLIAALAHDIKNPLAVIMGYAELKLEEMADGNPDKEIWRRMRDGGSRIVNLVTGFLEASRVESGNVQVDHQPVQVNRLLREAARAQEREAQRKNLTLELDLEQELPEVLGDEVQLDRAFWNLIGNAIKFTPHGGKVAVSSRLGNGDICVAVKDTGVGIPQEELPSLFSQFRRLKGSERIEGTGLGLFIVKTVIEAHHGTVEAVSEEGEGSTFSIHLPLEG